MMISPTTASLSLLLSLSANPEGAAIVDAAASISAGVIVESPVSPTTVVGDRYVDRGRARTVWPRAAGSKDGWRGVTVVEDDTGRVYPAEVSGEAILTVASGAPLSVLADRLGFIVVKPLFVDAGIYLVADRSTAAVTRDGVQLAADIVDAALEEIVSAIPDLALARTFHDIDVPPNDPLVGGQWFYTKMKMEDAWTLEDGVVETGIAVIDNGCEIDHPDLWAKLDPGRDFVDNDDDPSPEVADGNINNHGTACAGLVGAMTDNGLGVSGMCPECAVRCGRLLPDDGGLVQISTDVEVFQWVSTTGVAVASNSWGFNNPIATPAPLAQAVNQAFDFGRNGNGVVIVFAAGNDARTIGDDELCAERGVLCVGAITNFDETTSFTNKGRPVDLVAYTGTATLDITGAFGENESDYAASFGGTSSACPVASGAAALIMSANPDLSASEVVDIMLETLRPAPYATPDENGHDVEYGFGILDPPASLRVAKGIADDGGVRDDAGISEPDADGGDDDDDEPPTGCEGCSSTSTSSTFAFAVLLLAVRARRSRR